MTNTFSTLTTSIIYYVSRVNAITGDSGLPSGAGVRGGARGWVRGRSLELYFRVFVFDGFERLNIVFRFFVKCAFVLFCGLEELDDSYEGAS